LSAVAAQPHAVKQTSDVRIVASVVSLRQAVRQAQALLKRHVVLAVICFAGCNPLRGCVESEFVLSPASRLPRWFTESTNANRNEFEVELYYYAPPAPDLINNTVISMRDRSGRTIETVTGNSCWHPATTWTPNGDGSFTPAAYPHYVIVTVRGAMEVVEHPGMTNQFLVSDDPAVVQQARDSLARGECRRES
jgi:hypothetical protein